MRRRAWLLVGLAAAALGWIRSAIVNRGGAPMHVERDRGSPADDDRAGALAAGPKALDEGWTEARVRVADEEGGAWAGVDLEGPCLMQRATTDPDGFALLIMRKGAAPTTLQVRADDGRQLGELSVDVNSTRLVLARYVLARVIVSDEHGVPVGGAVVSFRVSGNQDDVVSDQTSPAGVAELRLPRFAVGVLTVVSGADGPPFGPRTLERWVPRTEWKVDVVRTLAVSGTVRRLDGTPEPHASVFWRTSLSRAMSSEADAQGRFRVVVSSGPVVLVAGPPGATFPSEEAEELVVTAPASGLTLRVPAGGEIRVHLRTDADAGRATVVLVRPPDTIVQRLTPRSTEVVFRAIPLGSTYTIAFQSAAGFYGSALSVAPGDEVSIAPRRGRDILGRVVVPDGWTLRDATVWHEGVIVRATLSGSGAVRGIAFQGVPHGAMRMTATLLGRAKEWLSVEVALDLLQGEGDPHRIELPAGVAAPR